MIKLWKQNLLFQVVGSFSLLSLTIVTLVGYLAFTQAKASLKQSVFDRLTTAASLKEGELNRWLLDRRDTLVALSQLPEINTQAQVLLTQDKSTSDYQFALNSLQTTLNSLIRNHADYQEIVVLSKGGRVLVSTNPNHTGRYVPLDQSSDVLASSRDTTFVSNFYPSSITNKPTTSFGAFIVDQNGQRLGMLVVHLNLARVDEIIRDNRGLGSSGETYLVANLGDNFAQRNTLVSAEEFASEGFIDGVKSPGIIAAMAGHDGRGLYPNYRDVSVIGVYRWLEAQDVALLVEMEQAEAFKPARRLASSILLLGLGLAGVMTIGMLILGRRIVKPILAIAHTAKSVIKDVKVGDFCHLQTAPILTENEIGFLAETFNQMTQQLQDSYEKLQEYSHGLEEKVQVRTQELENKNEYLQLTLKELKQTQTQLIQNEKMASLGQMVAGIAHEINNPVNFIHANLNYLEEYTSDILKLIQLYETEYPVETPTITIEKEEIDFEFIQSDLIKIVESMNIGTKRIKEIVLSLRNFSRLDEADLKVADLHEGIESTLLILQHRLKACSEHPEIKIIKEYSSIPQVECYVGQLNQVLINLISNGIDALESAIKAGEITNPSITISTYLEEEKAVISIADNGTGMSESTRQKIFDPFFTTKDIGKGTGLGLSISYSIIVERHQGELTCISSPGEGAEFIIAIPIKKRNDNSIKENKKLIQKI
ncbi:MAG: ATP-binding protein [Microcoleaceae cyanobacterium]